MSYSLVFPSQWDDFESMFDKLVTDRYGPAPNANPNSNLSNNSVSPQKPSGSSAVSRILRPKIDIVETEDGFILTAELPGAKKGNLSFFLLFPLCLSSSSSFGVFWIVYGQVGIDVAVFFCFLFFFIEDISIDLQSGRLTVSTQTKSSAEHKQGNVRVRPCSFIDLF